MTLSMFTRSVRTISAVIAGTAGVLLFFRTIVASPGIPSESTSLLWLLIAGSVAISAAGWDAGSMPLERFRNQVLGVVRYREDLLRFSNNLLVSSLAALLLLFVVVTLTPASRVLSTAARFLLLAAAVGLTGSLALRRGGPTVRTSFRFVLTVVSSAFLGWGLSVLITVGGTTEVVAVLAATSANGLLVWTVTGPPGARPRPTG